MKLDGIPIRSHADIADELRLFGRDRQHPPRRRKNRKKPKRKQGA